MWCWSNIKNEISLAFTQSHRLREICGIWKAKALLMFMWDHRGKSAYASPKTGMTATFWTWFACILHVPSTCPIKTVGFNSNLPFTCFLPVESLYSMLQSQISAIEQSEMYSISDFCLLKKSRGKWSELKNIETSRWRCTLKIKATLKIIISTSLFYNVWLCWFPCGGEKNVKFPFYTISVWKSLYLPFLFSSAEFDLENLV